MMSISNSFYPMTITLLASGIMIEDIGLGRSGLDYPSVPSVNTGACQSKDPSAAGMSQRNCRENWTPPTFSGFQNGGRGQES